MLKVFLRTHVPNLSRKQLFSTAQPPPTTHHHHRFITTPIFYVNAKPHVGHLHSALLADASARWLRASGHQVLFTTGTDEHGLKVQEAAEASNQHPGDFCDQVSTTFSRAFDAANIQSDRFVRTTDSDHKIAVQTMWGNLIRSGDLYCGTHEGWYCASDEVFLPDNQVTKIDDKCTVSTESGKQLRWVSEENWKFKLSAYEDRLLEWLEPKNGTVSPVRPPERVNEVKELIANGLRDISVSRLAEKVPWAIPVPNDSKHSIYVWVDALTNYLTVTGYGTEWGVGDGDGDDGGGGGGGGTAMSPYWPPDCHIIGKDILRFHAVYWPAFLMASNLPLPRSIVAHGHWTSSRIKMSKSIGNVVSPTAIMDKWGVDPVRYFFLRDGSLSNDADFSEHNVSVRYSSELADTLGNLISRCTGKSLLPTRQVNLVGPGVLGYQHDHLLNKEDHEMIQMVSSLSSNVAVHYDHYEFNKGIDLIMSMLREANGYFSKNEPWKIRKSIRGGTSSTNDQIRLDIIVYITLECIRVAGILLQPIIPASSDVLLTYINVSVEDRTLQDAQTYGRQNDKNKTMQVNPKDNGIFSIEPHNFVLFDKKKMMKQMKDLEE